MRRARKVKPVKNKILLIEFDNGEQRIFNCYPLLEDKLYAALSDEEFFKTVHIDEMGLVCWNDATDINPTFLYDKSEPVSNLSF